MSDLITQNGRPLDKNRIDNNHTCDWHVWRNVRCNTPEGFGSPKYPCYCYDQGCMNALRLAKDKYGYYYD